MSDKTTVDVLREARALLSDRKHWTHHAYARDARSVAVEPRDSRAARWCAMGALERVRPATDSAVITLAAHMLARAVSGRQTGAAGTVMAVNDMRGYRFVLAMYDEAIRLAEAVDGGLT